jgi:hypothetical protein
VVNTKIDVPPQAEPGRYTVTALISAAHASLRDEIGFEVTE